jgi:hypothetical protein
VVVMRGGKVDVVMVCVASKVQVVYVLGVKCLVMWVFLAPWSVMCRICEMIGQCVSIMCVVGFSRVRILLIGYLQFWWVLV